MKVTILMGLYNCESTLEQAITSIQQQTYSNWELIMCDDGSSDNTFLLASSLAKQDDRIILLKNDNNKGLNITLNRCLRIATGDYIARMDADDESINERLEKQVGFLSSQDEFDIVSSWMILFDENGEWGIHKTKEFPQSEDVVCGSPICHAPVMMRKKCLDNVGGYTEEKKTIRVEDVDLWIKLYSKGYRCFNIQEPLYKMRNDNNALNRRKYRYRIYSTRVRLRGCRLLHLGIKCYIKSFRPMLIGLVPAQLRMKFRKKQKND